MKRRATLEREVTEWNTHVKIGDTVEYRDYPEANPQTFTTRTPAEILSGHTAVVWLNGKAGCVHIDACRKVSPNEQIERAAFGPSAPMPSSADGK
jgi:hypothetical protein